MQSRVETLSSLAARSASNPKVLAASLGISEVDALTLLNSICQYLFTSEVYTNDIGMLVITLEQQFTIQGITRVNSLSFRGFVWLDEETLSPTKLLEFQAALLEGYDATLIISYSDYSLNYNSEDDIVTIYNRDQDDSSITINSFNLTVDETLELVTKMLAEVE